MTKFSKENRKYQEQVPRLQQRLKRDTLTLKIQARKIEELKTKMVESLETEQSIKQTLLKEREENHKIQEESIIKIKDQKYELEELKRINLQLEDERKERSLASKKDKQIIMHLQSKLQELKRNNMQLEDEKKESSPFSEISLPVSDSRTSDSNSFTNDLISKLQEKRKSKLQPILTKRPEWGSGPGVRRLYDKR
mmetsp:Transcript_8288/g.9797  ORF Transcript_8288/g.9797 Transcript_8288/m.9797 type:complete len:195 (+) Transcript_8288:3-587(+)